MHFFVKKVQKNFVNSKKSSTFVPDFDISQQTTYDRCAEQL